MGIEDFDIDKTIDDMISAIAGSISGDWEKLQKCIETAIKNERDALKAIADAHISGEINEDELKSQLEDEKVTLEAALLACKVKGKILAQNAINSAIKTIIDAIKAAL